MALMPSHGKPRWDQPGRANDPKRPAEIVTREDLWDKDGLRKLCGKAIDQPGTHNDWLCHQMAMLSNGRCKFHGGLANSDEIPDRPNEGDKRSTLLTDLGWKGQFDEYRADPELESLQHELALVDLLITKSLKRFKQKDTPENEKRLTDQVKLRRQLCETIKRNKDESVPKSQVLTFIYAITNIVFKYVTDPRQKAEFLKEIRVLMGRPIEPEDKRLTAPPVVDAERVEVAVE